MAKKPFGVGCDHAGIELKAVLVAELERRGFSVRDFGTYTNDSCDYPDFAHVLAKAVSNEEIDQGLLVCGTGVGMAISVNRYQAVRAVVCSEPLSARMARKHNNANVLCIGARVVGPDTALDVLAAFLDNEFEGGRHARRVHKINPA